MPAQAIRFWLRAGERSRWRSAVLEAIGHFQRGLEMARGLPDGANQSRQILALLLALGDAQRRTNGQLVNAWRPAGRLQSLPAPRALRPTSPGPP